MSNMENTVPAATPGDQLLSNVIMCVALIGVLCVLIIGALAILERGIPDVLENVTVASVTGLVALLAGRTRA
jgi:hypothetical protein